MLIALALTLFQSPLTCGPRLQGAPPSAPANVLVIVLDDIGWPERPLLTALDSFAASGVEFTRAYSFPTCSPTRLAATFGHLPRRDGIGDLSLNAHDVSQDRLPLDLFSVAELFAPSRQTALFGKWHLGRVPLDNGADILTGQPLAKVQVPIAPYVQGFEVGRAISPTTVAAGPGASGYYDWWRVDDGLMTIETRYAVNAERDEFLAWWGATSGPKFGWLAFSAAHSPFDPPPGKTATGTVRGDYEQVVEHLDVQLATVLASVSLADTFVVIFGDNGTPDDARPVGSASGIWKGSTFEGGIRVPFYVAGPGVKSGATTTRLVSVTDIPATLAELAGVAVPGGFEDSRSFANALGTAWTGGPARSHVFIERYDVVASGAYPQGAGFDSRVWIEGSLKRSITDEDGPGPLPASDMIYDLASDPGELSPTPFSSASAIVQARFSGYLAGLPPRL